MFAKRYGLHETIGGKTDSFLERLVTPQTIDCSRITPGNTLLFFDEIQACPRAITALRYFYEQMPELHVVAAGSMAEFILISPADTDETVQQMILNELRNYFFIGGMPECIKTCRNTGSMLETFQVQSEILDSYRDDFSKYMPRIDPICLDVVFLNVASIGEQIKYTRLNADHSSQTNRKAFASCLKKYSNCPKGLVLYSGKYSNLSDQKLMFLPLYSVATICDKRSTFV